MQRIILASNSPQRKELLTSFGIPFKVMPSRVEEVHRLTHSCASLVKHNALLKARDVARRLTKGIVLGADTLVYLGDGHIVGKPKNMAEAKKMLKHLSRNPHWVYTGMALVDAQTQKTLVDFEKTKIYMNPLSENEINYYYRHISPLDKSGGFDVQGKGAFLVRRMDGCFYNVVGLPLAKLYQMLRKMGFSFFMFFLLAGTFAGCATEYNLATEQQETLMYSTAREVQMGDTIAAEFEKSAKLIHDVDLNEKVSKILDKIVSVCDRKDILYHIKIIDDDVLNAFSLPGGYVYLNKGLIDRAKNDDELACVIGHEVGHITARHSIKKLQSLYGYTFLKVLTATTTKSADFVKGVDLAFASIFTGYSQEDEFLSDKLGIKYARKAGYNPEGMAGFLEELEKTQAKEPANQFTYWRTHPYIPQRIAAANQEVKGVLEFKDYLNLVGER